MDEFELAKTLFIEGSRLLEEKRYDEAENKLRESLSLIPDRISILTNLSAALVKQGKLHEAKQLIEKIISIDVNTEEAWLNYGLIFVEESNQAEAIKCFDKALNINPDYAEAWLNKGASLLKVDRIEETLVCYERAKSINPGYDYLFGKLLHTRMQICDWDNLDASFSELTARVLRGEKAATPFSVLGFTSSPALQIKAAEIWFQYQYPMKCAADSIAKYTRKNRIRIGYYSADYRNHAMAYLMAQLYESHDRDKFELIAFSFGPDNNDEMRQRLTASFDKFIDVRLKSDKDIAQMSRDMEIDIAIDQMGFTIHSRPGIFSERAAPLQVSYLGYPGTMGADYIDYLIADTILIPQRNQQYYSEKIIYMPNSYQVNDSNRRISDKVFTREELGLPASGFVFCCFNNNYKITDATFDGFVRIMKQVPGSVLWLLEGNSIAAENLKQEAMKRGISTERLVFAKRMPLDEHLARHRLADIFIDTLPYNAHTTASDALWSGLPVITCKGEAFASRVAASLLNAIGLPELVTSTQQEFEALAVDLAINPVRLEKIKQQLEGNRLTKPLFDTHLFTRNLEAMYTTIYERYQSDLPPEHIY